MNGCVSIGRENEGADDPAGRPRPGPRRWEPGRERDEEELASAFEAVETVRRQFKEKYRMELARIKHFTVEHGGGNRTMIHLDVPFNSCRGVPCADTSRDLLSFCGLNGEFGCAFENTVFKKPNLYVWHGVTEWITSCVCGWPTAAVRSLNLHRLMWVVKRSLAHCWRP